MVIASDQSEQGTARSPQLSIVVVTAGDTTALGRSLGSLAAQDASPELFEIIVVQYGPDDGVGMVIEDAGASRPGLQIQRVQSAPPGSGRARAKWNGVEASRAPAVLFLEEGDRLSEGFVTGALSNSSSDRLCLPLAMVDGPDLLTQIHRRPATTYFRHAGTELDLSDAGQILHTAAGIVYPRSLLERVGLDTDLLSGEDAVLLARVVSSGSVVCVVPDPADDLVYYSCANRPSADLGVDPQDLLASSERLRTLCSTDDLRRRLEPFFRLATTDLNAYLRQHPEAHREIVRQRRDRRLEDIVDLRVLNDGVARDLAVIYTSVPYVDTSANVAARRVAVRGLVVDVITNKMSKRLRTDHSSEALWEEYVDRRVEIAAHPSETWWPGVTEFCRKGMAQIARLESAKGPYRTVYSRVMHPTSHFLAAWLKLRRPEITWTAEFSDPVRHDVRGAERPSTGAPDPVMLADFRLGFEARGLTPPGSTNLYHWLEAIVYAFADEIVFTNEHQRELMLNEFPDQELVSAARPRSTVSQHPVPEARFYELADSDYEMPSDRINLAYFGVFYPTRGLGEVWRALTELPDELRKRVLLHVFTSKPDDLKTELNENGLGDVVRANPYVSYLEYLTLAARADVLLVNDAKAREVHGINPYLPSKWSDYTGSGSKVWGIVEPGSVLSGCPLDYRSELGDVAGAVLVIREICRERRALQDRPMDSVTLDR